MAWLFRIVGRFLEWIVGFFTWLVGGGTDAGSSEPPEPAEFIVEAPPEMNMDTIGGIFRERFGGTWRVSKVFRNFNPDRDLPELARYFFVTRPQPVEGNQFDASYSLMKGSGLMSATPNQRYKPPRRNPTRKADVAAPPDRAWHLRQIQAVEAWQVTRGGGVRIGHPDTGWMRHEDLDSSRLRADLGYDFVRDQDDSEDPFAGGSQPVPDEPGHGTKTGSVIMSGGDVDAPPTGTTPGGTKPPGEVTGVAPDAELVPIRCMRSVVIVDDRALAAAIQHAVDRKCDVISISLGGFSGPLLHQAVRNAVANNVIVVAAAGNEVAPVVFPAAYAECIAVGGSAVSGDTDWEGSAWGIPVDICAPAERVWRAEPAVTNASNVATGSKAGSGTSYATACVAGVAALWISAHTRDRLLDKYRGVNFLQEVFRRVIATTAHVPDGWDPLNFGAGIIRADGAVRAPLPDLPLNPVTVIKTILDFFLDLFAAIDRELARFQLVLLFAGPGGTLTDAELESLMQQYGVELMHLFLDDSEAFERFRESVRARAEGDAERARDKLQETGAALQQGASNTFNQVIGWVS